MRQYLPKSLRPTGTNPKVFRAGAGDHLPRWFYDNIKAIDKDLYFVWHPYRLIYDDLMNQYLGSPDDGRFCIHEEFGQEIWGWILKQVGNDDPAPEEKWHLWRECWPYGWVHVTCIESEQEEYLKLIGKRLWMQARISDTYGRAEWNRMNEAEKQEFNLSKQKAADQLFADVQDENKWLTKKAMENFDRGDTDPTNPMKESIVSYPGQIKRSKIVRPITDTEGGLVIPDSWKD